MQFLNDDANPVLEDALAKGQTVGCPLMGEDECVVGKANETPATASAAWSPEKAEERKMWQLDIWLNSNVSP